MTKTTHQTSIWQGEFGQKYTDRNSLSVDELNHLYKANFGQSRVELNERFLADVDREACILEVGSNVGNQLICLQSMGFRNLYGIELQSYAVELSKSRTTNINIIQGSAFDIPYKDSYFDLVFTSGVLIHIHPSDIINAMREIHRCTRKYIWGFEYYANEYSEISYRGHNSLLWKTDFAKLYTKTFPDLHLVQEERVKYLENDNIDSMFLLRKI